MPPFTSSGTFIPPSRTLFHYVSVVIQRKRDWIFTWNIVISLCSVNVGTYFPEKPCSHLRRLSTHPCHPPAVPVFRYVFVHLFFYLLDITGRSCNDSSLSQTLPEAFRQIKRCEIIWEMLSARYSGIFKTGFIKNIIFIFSF